MQQMPQQMPVAPHLAATGQVVHMFKIISSATDIKQRIVWRSNDGPVCLLLQGLRIPSRRMAWQLG
jgi:hypothetical protein